MAAGRKWCGFIGIMVWMVLLILALSSSSVLSAHEVEMVDSQRQITGKEVKINLQSDPSHNDQLGTYKHVWPEIRFGWRIVVGTMIAFIGAAFGSVGGVGGGGIYIAMLTLVIGFDQKSSIAISKCMITGNAIATVLYNLRRRHPNLELPIIDYDLALLFQPLLVLGISIGVSLNVVLPDWMITILLFIVLLGTSTRSFFKGVEIWKKETIAKNSPLTETLKTKQNQVSVVDNVCWKELGVIVAVWIIILALQISKNYVRICSAAFWLLDLFQIPVAVGVSSYQAVNLFKGRSVIASKGEEASTNWPVYKLVAYCGCGIAAGMLGGLLGLGGAFLLAPLFLEMGIPPQVSSATAIFAMAFSSSMSVVEYYLLKHFPVPYALYFAAVTTVSATLGQHVAGKVIQKLGRASLIIFCLVSTTLASSVTLGGIGIANIIKRIEHKESLGFQNICTYKA